MNCRACENLISAYVDGELTGWQMIEVRRHIEACPECVRELKEFRILKSALSSSVDLTPDESLHTRMMAGIEKKTAVKSRKWTMASLAVASAVFAVFAASAVFARLNQPLRETSADVERPFNAASDRVYASGADPFSNHVQSIPVGFR